MSNPTPGPPDPPEYKVYRARKRPLSRLAGGTDFDSLKRRLSRAKGDEPGPDTRDRKRITPGRVLKWLALAVLGWLVLSFALFMISAQIQDGVSDEAERALSRKGNLMTGSTILVLGSDARTGESIDDSQGGPSRADTIMLVHAALGSVRKLSIPRDIEVEVPGHGTNKINAAYALGGPALTIETVESFLGNGLKVNHLVEVDFDDFPELIDSLGGITVNNKSRICSPPFDNFWRGLTFRKGRDRARRPACPGLRARSQEPVCPGGGRPGARRPPAGGAARAGGAGEVAEHVLSPALGELEGAQGAQDRHEGPRTDGAVRRHGHRQLRRDRGARVGLLHQRRATCSSQTAPSGRPSTSC